MSRREENVYDDDNGNERREDPRPRHTFQGMIKMYEARQKRTYMIEFMPDTTEQLAEIGRMLGDRAKPDARGDSPDLNRVRDVCRTLEVRARVLLQSGQYLGHVWSDGSLDPGLQRIFN